MVKRLQPVMLALLLASVVFASGADLIGTALTGVVFILIGLFRKPFTRWLIALGRKIRLTGPGLWPWR